MGVRPYDGHCVIDGTEHDSLSFARLLERLVETIHRFEGDASSF